MATGNAVDGEPPHPLEHVELTQAEAEAIVADFLERADIGTFGISHIEKARTVRSYSGETISEGWRIKCARVCGDCRRLPPAVTARTRCALQTTMMRIRRSFRRRIC